MSLERDLRSVAIFADLSPSEIAWLEEHVDILELAPGEVHLREGDEANVMFAVLEGEIRSRREKGTPDGKSYVVKPGQVSGMLPRSRMTHFPITSRAVVPTRLACFATASFPEMLSAIPVLEARLASVMADRVKQTTELEQFRDRLMSLGKLSAGLAHELNNPAAAIQRSIDELDRRVASLSELSRSLLEQLAGPEAAHGLLELGASRRHSGSPEDPLERSAQEEEIADWLAERGFEEPWFAAETFASAGLGVRDLDTSLDVPEVVRAQALRWLDAHLASRQLVFEIAEAATRISGIVTAVKSYSHMDRTQARTKLEVTKGLDDTLTVLSHKLRDKGVTVTRDYAHGLRRIMGNVGELNQVWTNLIDNAIDAAPKGSEISIRATANETGVVVQIIDRGSGIPSETRQRMFEPFFTTKDVGSGTGLGLDIASRIVTAHHGAIHVESAPGRTCFEVRLPERGPGEATGAAG